MELKCVAKTAITNVRTEAYLKCLGSIHPQNDEIIFKTTIRKKNLQFFYNQQIKVKVSL